MKREEIIQAIFSERARQRQLNANPPMGKIRRSLEDEHTSDGYRLATLVEEVGEVSHVLNEASFDLSGAITNSPDLKKELVQVAAVCVAWLEIMT